MTKASEVTLLNVVLQAAKDADAAWWDGLDGLALQAARELLRREVGE